MASFFNATLNGAAGTAQGKVYTIQTFVISLASGFVLFGVQFGYFLTVRNYLWAKRIYQPRTFLIPYKQRVKPPPNNPFKWLYTIFKIQEDPEVLRKAGMDAYFFLRYLSMCLKIFFPMAVFILPILLPLNYNHGKFTNTIAGVPYNVTGLDTLAWSNVSPANTNRYWAHLVCAVGVVSWVCFLFHQELMHYVIKRQEYLTSSGHRLKASSTTVLITDIPTALCTVDALEELYGDFPGGVRRIWLNRDFTKLVNKDKQRLDFEDRLENAETNLIRKAIKQHRKQSKQGKIETSKPTFASTTEDGDAVGSDPVTTPSPTDSAHNFSFLAACQWDLQHDVDTKATWTQYVTPKQRPTMRIPNGNHPALFRLPIVGRFFSTRVDTIYYSRRELARMNKEIETDGETPDSYPQNRSAFIQFNTQKAAHMACQTVADTMPRSMTQRAVEISPADVNWHSLNLSWRARYLHRVGFFFLFVFVVFVFGIISLFTGILSKFSSLAGSASWLHWIGSMPKWLKSFIQGTLPPVIQVILLSGPLPIVLRAMTNSTRGAITGSDGERSLQLWYFIFLLIELFIIPTLSSGITSIVQQLIQSPTSVPALLATYLPTAANYYFSFLIVQALSISASSIAQTIRLLNFYVIGSTNTPDSVFAKLSFTWRTRIGSNIPWYTTFAVIGIVYSVIAPLILIFMIITFSLFWVVIKNNVLFVVRTGDVDGGGLFFPSAINQTFTGLYFMEFCLIGLFFLVRDAEDKVTCEAQGIIMAVVLVLTIIYQVWLSLNFSQLFQYAPIRLEVEVGRQREEAESKGLLETDETSVPTRQNPKTEIKEYGDIQNTKETPIADAMIDESHLSEFSQEPIERPSYPRLPSTNSYLRSKDIQAQQKRDAESAKRILARVNRPLNESRLAQLEENLERVEGRVGRVSHLLLPNKKDIEAQMMNDPISKIIMQHNDELEDLDVKERDMLVSIAFTHPILREARPAVWIPRDDLGVSDDEVARTRAFSKDLVVDNRGAYFDKRLKVQVDKPPPDMSEFALIMPEL